MMISTSAKKDDIEEICGNTESNNQTIPTAILILRGQFPKIVMHVNQEEDNWLCDICLSVEPAEGNEEDDPLTICELCNVVVHPTCYRRDLFELDPSDD